MKYRDLGNTGLKVSEIGFGAWGLGGTNNGAIAYGKTDDDQSINALQYAYQQGVNFYDTSNLYGMGHSEKIIGRAFKGLRHKVIIATKGGILNTEGEQDFTETHLRSALEQSLIRIQSDYIDLYQLHSPPKNIFEKNSSLKHCLESFIKEGKVRSIAVSCRSPQDAIDLIKTYKIKAVQVNLSLIDMRAIECNLIEICKKHGASIIARTPLCFGFLTGRYSSDSKFDLGDHRSRWKKKQIDQWTSLATIFSNTIKSGGPQSATQKALRFCLSFPEVATVIPGMLTCEQVTENIKASTLGPLQMKEIESVKEIYNKNSTYLDNSH